MKIILIAIVLFSISIAAVAQEKPLTQAEYVKMLYALEKAPSTKPDVVDALRRRGIAFVLTDGVRGLTRSKGRNDEELKRALEEADRRRQNPETTKLPSKSEGDSIIEKARSENLRAVDEMPDFVVKQLIARSYAYAGTGNWKPSDNLTIAVSYSEKEGEQYKVLAINGAAVTAERGSNYGGLEGSSTTGEFVETLARIFAPKSKTEFSLVTTDSFQNRRTIVFEYSIAAADNPRGLSYQKRISTPTGEKGRIWVDAENFRVLKIANEFTDIPSGFPITAFRSSIEYGWVTIVDQKYLLPTLSEAIFTVRADKVSEQSRNVIRFRNYQKYGSEVKAVGEDEDVPPEKP